MGGVLPVAKAKEAIDDLRYQHYEGKAVSDALDCPADIRLIKFTDFLDLGTFPRYPDNKDIVRTMDQITVGEFNRSLIIFVSHCWLRGWNGAEGWDGRPHPDNADGDKYQLCVDGISQILQSLFQGGVDNSCYIWLDFGCIDQDGNPAGELEQLDKIVQMSDLIFTPIFDKKHDTWDYPEGELVDALLTCKSEAWIGGPFSYVNRGWCRVEMFYAANIPLMLDDPKRAPPKSANILNKSHFMSAGLKFHREANRRPHGTCQP